MKETFEDYLQRLKDRRTEDNYKYTDEDFKNYIYYIFDCYEKGMSVYKCLEFMYFAEKDMDDQLFNRESKQECMITKIMGMDAKMAYDLLPKQETLEEFEEAALKYNEQFIGGQESRYAAEDFINGAKWQQERHNFLPGFIKQFDPKEGEIKGWTAVEFLKWLDLNKFKIIK
jgi:hypothetical protein